MPFQVKVFWVVLLLMEDIRGGTEKAMSMLPIQAAEEVQEGTVRNFKLARKPKEHEQGQEGGSPHTTE